MPTELKTAEQELNINSEQLNKNHPDFKTTIKKIKNNYTGKIPRDWITPMLPDLPSISETQKYLTNNNISINMPILEDQNFTTNIKLLREHFFFERLPPEFITEPESPEPVLTLLPKLI